MRKNQVNKILINQSKRRETVLSFLCVIFMLMIISITLMYIYTKKNNEQYVTYNENSEIDYKVYLKDNKYFELDTNMDDKTAIEWYWIYEDITDYEEYPENGRLVLKYGMTIDEVIEKLVIDDDIVKRRKKAKRNFILKNVAIALGVIAIIAVFVIVGINLFK